MSELKTQFIDDTYVEYYNTGKHELAQIYLKSEADKVIAELKKSKMAWVHRCGVAEEHERHHKYKRCLAMAEMCCARYDEEDANVNGYGASWEYISKEMKYWERWRWRWDALAEKFKEAK